MNELEIVGILRENEVGNGFFLIQKKFIHEKKVEVMTKFEEILIYVLKYQIEIVIWLYKSPSLLIPKYNNRYVGT